jgi:quinol monooxygenase YgiN
MIKHIVLWKLKEENKQENALLIKQRLEALVGQIDGLNKLEVGINFNEKGWDLCLYGEYRDKAALAFYQNHEKHKAVQQIVHAAMLERAVVDYEA